MVDTVVRFLAHPLSAAPITGPLVEDNREDILLKGAVLSLLSPPSGCEDHPRCNETIPEHKRQRRKQHGRRTAERSETG
jgi:ABC-type dipeptide/oligopeptide/nickel transport system ATPase component